MTDNKISLFDYLVSISRTAFEDGHIGAAYHALMAAMYMAEDARNWEDLFIVEDVANEQRTWLDANMPTHRLSTESSARRGHQSVYASLLRQVSSLIRTLASDNT